MFPFLEWGDEEVRWGVGWGRKKTGCGLSLLWVDTIAGHFARVI